MAENGLLSCDISESDGAWQERVRALSVSCAEKWIGTWGNVHWVAR